MEGKGLEDELGHEAEGLGLGGAHDHRGDAALAPRVEAVGDLVFLLTGDLLTFLAAAALIGFGDFFTSSQTALLSEVVPAADRTKVLSTYRFSADLGALIGPVLLAIIMDVANAQTAIVVAAAILFTASLAARFGVPDPRVVETARPSPAQ